MQIGALSAGIAHLARGDIERRIAADRRSAVAVTAVGFCNAAKSVRARIADLTRHHVVRAVAAEGHGAIRIASLAPAAVVALLGPLDVPVETDLKLGAIQALEVSAVVDPVVAELVHLSNAVAAIGVRGATNEELPLLIAVRVAVTDIERHRMVADRRAGVRRRRLVRVGNGAVRCRPPVRERSGLVWIRSERLQRDRIVDDGNRRCGRDLFDHRAEVELEGDVDSDIAVVRSVAGRAGHHRTDRGRNVRLIVLEGGVAFTDPSSVVLPCNERKRVGIAERDDGNLGEREARHRVSDRDGA